MRITVAAIGRLKGDAEQALVARYVKRFDSGGRGLGLGPITIVELPEARHPTVDQRKTDEAGRLLSRVPTGATVVALDETGHHLDSPAFAARLARDRDDGAADWSLLIGGPDGHGPLVFERAHLTLALGAMTLPHGLARAVLLEQLYRATTILAGHPYHRA